MNWGQFKVPVSHMCPAASVVAHNWEMTILGAKSEKGNFDFLHFYAVFENCWIRVWGVGFNNGRS